MSTVAPATEADALAVLDRLASTIVDNCGPLRPWDIAAPFDAAIAALARRVRALSAPPELRAAAPDTDATAAPASEETR